MWTSNIESIVFSKIKYYVESKLKAKYPGLNLTTSSVRPVNPTFPTVYIHEMPGIETANDMESKVINSVSCTFQIEVTDANSEIIAKEVMNAIATQQMADEDSQRNKDIDKKVEKLWKGSNDDFWSAYIE